MTPEQLLHEYRHSLLCIERDRHCQRPCGSAELSTHQASEATHEDPDCSVVFAMLSVTPAIEVDPDEDGPAGLPRLAGRAGSLGLSGLPRSPSPMFGNLCSVGPAYSGKIALNFGFFLCTQPNHQCWARETDIPSQQRTATHRFHACELAAKAFFSASVPRIEPVVISSDNMNESSPVRMVATDQAGFHDPAWKSENDVQILRSGWSAVGRDERVSAADPLIACGSSCGAARTPT